MKTIHYIILFAVSFLWSCRKEIDISIPNNKRKIVLNTMVSADSGFYAQVFRSNHAQDNYNSLLYLNNATVEVFESGVKVEQLILDSLGRYSGHNITAEVGKTYEFRVAVPNLQSISGSTSVLAKTPILSIDSIGVSKIYDGDMDYVIYEINFDDAAGIEDYYRLKIAFEQPEIEPDTIWYGEGKEDYYINYGGVYYYGNFEPIDPSVEVWPYFDDYAYFTDHQFDGERYSFQFAIPFYNETPISFTASLEHISFDFYRYIKSINMQNDTEGLQLFFQAVQVFGNIEDGFGIIGSTSASVDSVRYVVEK